MTAVPSPRGLASLQGRLESASRKGGRTPGSREISAIRAQRELFPVPLWPACGWGTAAHCRSLTPSMCQEVTDAFLPLHGPNRERLSSRR